MAEIVRPDGGYYDTMSGLSWYAGRGWVEAPPPAPAAPPPPTPVAPAPTAYTAPAIEYEPPPPPMTVPPPQAPMPYVAPSMAAPSQAPMPYVAPSMAAQSVSAPLSVTLKGGDDGMGHPAVALPNGKAGYLINGQVIDGATGAILAASAVANSAPQTGAPPSRPTAPLPANAEAEAPRPPMTAPTAPAASPTVTVSDGKWQYGDRTQDGKWYWDGGYWRATDGSNKWQAGPNPPAAASAPPSAAGAPGGAVPGPTGQPSSFIPAISKGWKDPQTGWEAVSTGKGAGYLRPDDNAIVDGNNNVIGYAEGGKAQAPPAPQVVSRTSTPAAPAPAAPGPAAPAPASPAPAPATPAPDEPAPPPSNLPAYQAPYPAAQANPRETFPDQFASLQAQMEKQIAADAAAQVSWQQRAADLYQQRYDAAPAQTYGTLSPLFRRPQTFYAEDQRTQDQLRLGDMLADPSLMWNQPGANQAGQNAGGYNYGYGGGAQANQLQSGVQAPGMMQQTMGSPLPSSMYPKEVLDATGNVVPPEQWTPEMRTAYDAWKSSPQSMTGSSSGKEVMGSSEGWGQPSSTGPYQPGQPLASGGSQQSLQMFGSNPQPQQTATGFSTPGQNGYTAQGLSPMGMPRYRAGTSYAPESINDQYAKALPNPNQINAKAWMKMPGSTQQFMLGAYEDQGYAGDDVEAQVKNGLPKAAGGAYGRVA